MDVPEPKRRDFRIAVICALTLEAQMIQQVMDVNWDDHGLRIPRVSHDSNAYTLGRLGRHNIVLVHMPGSGNTTAAGTAAGLRRSFPSIEIVYLAGICGAAPKDLRDEDILLGDCIISTGVVQNDFGRRYSNDVFIPKTGVQEALSRAGPALRSQLSRLQTRTKQLTERLQFHLQEMQIQGTGVTYPSAAKDKLYQSDYIHKHQKELQRCDGCLDGSEICKRDCDKLGCEDTRLVVRTRPASPLSPRLFFGLYSSTNTVLRDAVKRDSLSRELHVIGFDMEAAGIWEHIQPAIIVKSACDYADSHKNKDFQEYASACGAAAVKALIEELDMPEDEDTMDLDMDYSRQYSASPSVSSFALARGTAHKRLLNSPDGQPFGGFLVGHTDLMTSRSMHALQSQESLDLNLAAYADLHSRPQLAGIAGRHSAPLYNPMFVDGLLQTPQYDDPYKRYLETRLDNTCGWILDKQAYKDWCSPHSSSDTKLLWLVGSAGSGKTTICATIIETLKSNPEVFHYFVSGQRSVAKADNIIRYWLSSIARLDQNTSRLVASLSLQTSPGRMLSTSDLWDIFRQVASELKDCYFILDGVDELALTDRGQFLNDLKTQLLGTKSRVLICSRDEPDIRTQLRIGTVSGLNIEHYHITQPDTEEDIRILSDYIVDKQLPEQESSFRRQLASTLTEKCHGMFLWVQLASESLNDGESKSSLNRIVEKAPARLHDTYKQKWSDLLQALSPRDQSRSMAILRWCCFGMYPLTVAQLAEALLVLPHDQDNAFPVDELPTTLGDAFLHHRIRKLCSSFIEVRPSDDVTQFADYTVHLIHASVRDFLITVLPIPGDEHEPQDADSPQALQHIYLSEICLRYLCYDNISAGTTDFAASFKTYATNEWSGHYRAAMIQRPCFLQLVSRFFESDHFAEWSTTIEDVEGNYRDARFDCGPGNALYHAARLGFSSLVTSMVDIVPVNSVGGYFGTPLQASVFGGHRSTFDALIQYGADIDICAGFFGTALIAAADAAQIELAQELLTRKVKLDAQNPYGCTAVYRAALANSIPLLRLLIENGADLTIATFGRGRSPLYLSASLGYVEAATILSQALVSKNLLPHVDRTRLGYTTLHGACFAGSTELVELFLSQGADPKAVATDGLTPLHIAASMDHVKIAELLIASGVNVNSENSETSTPLLLAMINNCSNAMVSLLLNAAADPNLAFHGHTPIYAACAMGNIDVLQDLFDHGATALYPITCCSPLHQAANRGDTQIVEKLLEAGVDPKARCVSSNEWQHGATPLYLASTHGHIDVVKLLLRSGVNLNEGLHTGWTPLHHASYHHIDVVRTLFEAGANLHARSSRGHTALHCAATGGNAEIIRLLLSYGADPDLRTDRQRDALFSAVQYKQLEAVKMLLPHKKHLIAVDRDGETYLTQAVNNESLDILQVLLNHDPRIAEDDRAYYMFDGKKIFITALSHAAGHGYLEIAKTLIKHGSPLHAFHPNCDVPIVEAAGYGDVAMVEILLLAGSDVNVNYIRGSPIRRACAYGHIEVVKTLLKHGADPCQVSQLTGYTSIHRVVLGQEMETLSILLEKSASLYSKEHIMKHDVSKEGGSSVHLSVLKGNLSILDELLKFGFRPDVKDNHNKTLLDFAAISGEFDTIKRCLDLGNYSLTNTSSWSVLHWACRRSSFEAIKLLCDAGMQSSIVETAIDGQVAALWEPLDVARFYNNTELLDDCGVLRQEFPWNTIPDSGIVKQKDGRIDASFSNHARASPNPSDRVYNCGGCESTIHGPCSRCKKCWASYYCFMCRHTAELNELHAGHGWEVLYSDGSEWRLL